MKSTMLPTDFMDKSIEDKVVYDIVDKALFDAGPLVVMNHIHTAFNELRESQDYASAVKLAGLVMRYAQEHKS